MKAATSPSAEPTEPTCPTHDRNWIADGTTSCTPTPRALGRPARAGGNGEGSSWPHLLTLKGPRRGDLFRIEADDLVLGRGERSEIRIGDPGISRRHSRIFRHGGDLLVEDLASKNGTTLNGRDLAVPSTLQGGDAIGLGRWATFRFVKTALEDEVFRWRMMRLAPRDPVTGTLARDFFVRRLAVEARLAHRHALPLTLLAIELDGPRDMDRILGQVGSERVLFELARRISKHLRREDLVSRWWYESFVVLAVGTDAEGGPQLARRLSRAVAAHPVVTEGHAVPISVTIGVAALPDQRFADSHALLAAARAAATEAKGKGPARIRVY